MMVTFAWGKQNRLTRLRTDSGYFLLMALDHGLSSGPLSGLMDLGQWVSFARQELVSGVVVNRGLLPSMPPLGRTGLILQTMGLPDRDGQGLSKVPVANITDAVQASADAISVQISFGNADGQIMMEKIGRLVSAAGEAALPVLFMVNAGRQGSLSIADLTFAIRACAELGADLIKVPLPDSAPSKRDMAELQETVKYGPPVLFAGGTTKKDFQCRVELAAELGFQGVCVGRNIFQAEQPGAVLTAIARCFAGTKK